MSTAFDDLSLRPELLEGVRQADYTHMTPIQAAALPTMLLGIDVLGQAETGTGKTAAFALAVLNRIDPAVAHVQAAILCPTRELADQVANEVRRLAQRLANTRVLTLCGGRSNRSQVIDIKRGCQIVVGTPGRVLQHLKEATLCLRRAHTVVLDEADRMLDMGFSEDVTSIVNRAPKDRQILLFSATFPDEIKTLSTEIQREAKLISVVTEASVPETLRQRAVRCEVSQRFEVLVDLLSLHRPETVLVFCETRDDCAETAQQLQRRGALAQALHGNMEQRDRDAVLLQFSNGSLPILVATNVAARGIDIQALPLVIITELSKDPQSHLHRVGRTGRAGEMGLAISIVTPRERMRLERIESYMDITLKVDAAPPPANGGLGFLQAQYRTLIIHAGKRDKIRKGDVLGALIKDGGVPNEAIGKIELQHNSCSVAIRTQYAATANHYLKTGRVKQKKVRARLL